MKQRLNKVSNPWLQFRMVAPFVVAAIGATFAFGAMMSRAMRQLATELPHDEQLLLDAWPSILFQNIALMAGASVLLLTSVGVLATHRVTGPLRRIEAFLLGVIEGAESSPCRIRQGDELQDLCALVNAVTENQRASMDETKSIESTAHRDAA